MTGSRIKAVKDYAISGYAHAAVVIKPWKALVDGKCLVDARGNDRRFASEHAALAAAARHA